MAVVWYLFVQASEIEFVLDVVFVDFAEELVAAWERGGVIFSHRKNSFVFLSFSRFFGFAAAPRPVARRTR